MTGGKITREMMETDTMAVEDFCVDVVLGSYSIGQSPLCMGWESKFHSRHSKLHRKVGILILFQKGVHFLEQ